MRASGAVSRALRAGQCVTGHTQAPAAMMVRESVSGRVGPFPVTLRDTAA
jgi:hypothetical protein